MKSITAMIICVLALCALLTCPSVEGHPRRGIGRYIGGAVAQADGSSWGVRGGHHHWPRCGPELCPTTSSDTNCSRNNADYRGQCIDGATVGDIAQQCNATVRNISSFCWCTQDSQCVNASYICYQPANNLFFPVGFCILRTEQETCENVTRDEPTKHCPYDKGCNGNKEGLGRRRNHWYAGYVPAAAVPVAADGLERVVLAATDNRRSRGGRRSGHGRR